MPKEPLIIERLKKCADCYTLSAGQYCERHRPVQLAMTDDADRYTQSGVSIGLRRDGHLVIDGYYDDGYAPLDKWSVPIDDFIRLLEEAKSSFLRKA